MNSIELPGASISYNETFLTKEESSKLYDYLNNLKLWEKKEILVYGKKCHQNRTTCFMSYPGLNYRYSGTDNIGDDLHKHPIVMNIKSKLENYLDSSVEYNYLLCNKYKDGTENIGMHSDDERDLCGPIASISIGCERFFDFKHKTDKEKKLRLTLKNGSLLIMDGDTQKNYKHGIRLAKCKKRPFKKN